MRCASCCYVDSLDLCSCSPIHPRGRKESSSDRFGSVRRRPRSTLRTLRRASRSPGLHRASRNGRRARSPEGPLSTPDGLRYVRGVVLCGATLRAMLCYVRCCVTCGATLRAVMCYIRTVGHLNRSVPLMHSGLNGIWQLVPVRDDVIAMEGHNSSSRRYATCGDMLRAVLCYVRCYATCGAIRCADVRCHVRLKEKKTQRKETDESTLNNLTLTLNRIDALNNTDIRIRTSLWIRTFP